jgi:hypothetical protein
MPETVDPEERRSEFHQLAFIGSISRLSTIHSSAAVFIVSDIRSRRPA